MSLIGTVPFTNAAANADAFKSPAAREGDSQKAAVWTRKPMPTETSAVQDLSLLSSVEKHGADKSHRMPLGELLQEKNSDKLKKFQEKLLNTLLASIRDNKLDHIERGTVLGRGGHKVAYDIPGKDQVLLVCEKMGPPLVNEVLNSDLLRSAGMPVAPILQVGTHGGREAMVLPKYETVFKPRDPKTASGREFIDSGFVTHRTLTDLKRIRDVIAKEGITVLDLQFGIKGKSGAIEVLDTFGVVPKNSDFGDHARQLALLDQNIAALKSRLRIPH